MPIGIILLALAILIDKFLPQTNLLDFTGGLFTGLSIVLNGYYIFTISKKSCN
jgi:hypothetical protein